MRNYYYEILENGYIIKDMNDATFSLYQYEKGANDFILYRTDKSDKDYAKYAQMHIDALKKADEEAEKERVTIEKLKTITEEQNEMIIDNTYRVTMLELMQSGINL